MCDRVWRHLVQKNLSCLKLYIIKRKFNFWNDYAIYFISWSEKMNISFVASPLMKYAFFASLDEINGIFIPKIWISSIYYIYTIIYNNIYNNKINAVKPCPKQAPQSCLSGHLSKRQYHWNLNSILASPLTAGNIACSLGACLGQVWLHIQNKFYWLSFGDC